LDLAQAVLTALSIMLLLPRNGERYIILSDALQSVPGAHEVVRRIHADFREMPGLRVTLRQGCRLWDVSPDICRPILDALVTEGFLSRSGEHYCLQ
jgi:hypothetical protein